MTELAELIAILQPGKHFIGLWVVKVKHRKSYRVWWCVSYIDNDNVHCETPLYAGPKAALRRAVRELKLA